MKLPRILIVIGCLVSLSVIGAYIGSQTMNYYSWEPDYNRAIHGHIQNAYWADTPELMIKELTLAREGMVDSGLEPSMYSDLRPWKQTPDRSMSYQYDHIDAIIERAEAVIQWRESQSESGEINDVYGAKMRDLRAFIKEDTWSDWIARPSYYIEHHRFFAILTQFSAFIQLGTVIVSGSLIGTGIYKSKVTKKQIIETIDKATEKIMGP